MVRSVFVPFVRNLVVATTRQRISYCLAPCDGRKFTTCQTTIFYAKTHQLFLLRCVASGSSKDNENSSKETSKEPSQMKSIGKETIVSVIPKRKSQRKKLDVTQAFTERNFITPLRAMNEYLLKPTDLEGLRKIQRRSPYEETPPLIVYLRTDVEAKALEKWKNSEALKRELRKKREEERAYKDNIFNMKKELKDSRRAEREDQELKRREKILRGSGRVVVAAVVINATNFILKLMAWLYTGSHSMFAEVIHSFADTCNQLILAFGIRKSIQQATREHPYGYHTMRYVASLISGVGIFCFGTGLSIYHGIMGLLHPEQMEQIFWAYLTLSISLMTEGGTLIIAYNSIKKGAFQEGMSVKEYVLRSQDPSVNVVLLEDLAAVLGVGIAATCMGLSSYMGSPVYDAVGSILVGGLLGTVASFIIYTNSAALVGRSIPPERLQMINKELENDVMIRAIHDVKATDMGNLVVRYKAEVDFDGRELTTSYLDSQDLDKLLQEIQSIKTFEEMEAFMLKHGENIVDLLGAHVDRIETTMKKRHPEVRHVDLEVL